ncbi:hypothetical protein Lal_00023150 [Lupinus albus]|nr:hypothetical protein Lal_00023150 [Lupinus albus]
MVTEKRICHDCLVSQFQFVWSRRIIVLRKETVHSNSENNNMLYQFLYQILRTGKKMFNPVIIPIATPIWFDIHGNGCKHLTEK